MKCYYPTDKSGNRIGFKTPEACIFDTSGTNLTNKLNKLRSDVNGKAAASHGHHVPSPQTANNKVYLRNDNTWHTLTPADIGAAASSHSHSWDSITGKPSLYTTSQIDSKISAINSNISSKISIIMSYTTSWAGAKFTAYAGDIYTVNINVPSGYTVYNIDVNITGITAIKAGFNDITDITKVHADIYVMNISEYEQIIPSNARIIITSLIIKN